MLVLGGIILVLGGVMLVLGGMMLVLKECWLILGKNISLLQELLVYVEVMLVLGTDGVKIRQGRCVRCDVSICFGFIHLK